MNAPFPRPHPASAPVSAIMPMRDWLATPDVGWQQIVARPSEPNSFAEPWFVRASVENLECPPDLRVVAVREEGQLIGLMPVHAVRKYGRMPVRHVENWVHYNAFFGAPMIRRGFEPLFWARALALIESEADAPPFVHIVGLDGDGPIAAALLRARRGAAIVHRIRRAKLQSPLSPADYYETNVRKKKRKEIGRLKARLAELGSVTYRRLELREDIAAWVDAFLTLEASGWKGSDAKGAALARDPQTAAFLRDAIAGAFDAGRLDLIRLDLDGRAIAMLINFLSPPGSYSFKVAYDEEYARFSPGVLIELENLNILDRPGIGWMDSCAVEGHPMIESLWAERRDIVRITVPLRGKRNRVIFTACRALERASAQVRRIAS